MTQKRAQKRPFFRVKIWTPPENFRRGGMRKRKNGKNRGGKIKEKIRFLHFFAKNDHFFDFGAIFWPFLRPPKKGVKNGQKMTPKLGVIFCRFCDYFFWFFQNSKKKIQKIFFKNFFFKNESIFFFKNFFSKNFFLKKLKIFF